MSKIYCSDDVEFLLDASLRFEVWNFEKYGENHNDLIVVNSFLHKLRYAAYSDVYNLNHASTECVLFAEFFMHFENWQADFVALNWGSLTTKTIRLYCLITSL